MHRWKITSRFQGIIFSIFRKEVTSGKGANLIANSFYLKVKDQPSFKDEWRIRIVVVTEFMNNDCGSSLLFLGKESEPHKILSMTQFRINC